LFTSGLLSGNDKTPSGTYATLASEPYFRDIREFEQDNEVRKRTWQNLSVCTLSCEYWVWGHWWSLNVSSRYRFMSLCLWILSPILIPGQNSKTWNYIPTLLFCHRSERIFAFVVNEDRRTKAGYSFMSC
jgi:hypothetical protein